jgi:hypothetical protein
MKRSAIAAGGAAIFALAATGLAAGPERVRLPADYAAKFERYNVVDRPDRSRVRMMYVNRAALEAAEAGQPAPPGTVLIMEDHDAEVDQAGNLKRDGEGRLVASPAVTGIFVMEKQAGWGEDVAAELRNGDWDYAAFQADGAPRPDLDTTGCFTCHQRRAARDFTFTFFKNVADGLK